MNRRFFLLFISVIASSLAMTEESRSIALAFTSNILSGITALPQEMQLETVEVHQFYSNND